MVVIIIIYLIGVIVSYILTKRFAIEEYKPDIWAVSDRIHCLIISILSWVNVVIELVRHYIFKNENKKANW